MRSLSMHIPTMFSEAFSLASNRTIRSIIIDRLLIKEKEGGEDLFQQERAGLEVIKGVIKYISRRKETEIRILFYLII